MERELILDLKDLAKIGVQCPTCHSRTIIEVGNPGSRPPHGCACGEQFYREHQRGDTPLDNLLDALKKQPPKYAITFHIAISPLQP
jgi:hypothetical protein